MASLQDQLLKAGLVDKNRLNKARKDKQKQAKAGRKSGDRKDTGQTQVQQQQKIKQQRDRALNQQKHQQISQKAINAEIKQLIETNRIDRQGGEIAYSFVDGKKVRKIYVTEALQKQLIEGRLGIGRYQRGGVLAFELVPAAIAEKIAVRDEKSVIYKNNLAEQSTQEDGDYADYQVPDDLMW